MLRRCNNDNDEDKNDRIDAHYVVGIIGETAPGLFVVGDSSASVEVVV